MGSSPTAMLQGGSKQRLGRDGLQLASPKTESRSAGGSRCPPRGQAAPGPAAPVPRGLPGCCGRAGEPGVVAVHRAAGSVPGCGGAAWGGRRQRGPPLRRVAAAEGAVVGQGTRPLPQGSVVAACEGLGSCGEERLALPGSTASFRVALIWPGCILPVGRLSVVLYPEHPCFTNRGRALGHGCIMQHLPPVG